MQIEYIGAFQIFLGVLARFWPVWLAMAIVLAASFNFRKNLGLYGQLYDSGVGIAGLVGAGCFLLSAYGLSVLSARPLGIVLLVLAVFGFTVDVQSGAPRLWSGVGAVALVAGSLLLYRDHDLSWIALAIGIQSVPERDRHAEEPLARDQPVAGEAAHPVLVAHPHEVGVPGELPPVREQAVAQILIARAVADHADLPLPPQVGRRVGLKRD